MMPWLFSALGLVILLLAGDALVRGAVNLSLRVGIPALIVSLTIVAFGTSAPELLIAVQAVHENADGIALGNVVGSNTANILLVLGIPAMLRALHTSECDTRKNYIFMIAASVLFIALAFFGTFTWLSGLILLLALAVCCSPPSARLRRTVRRESRTIWKTSRKPIPACRFGGSASIWCLVWSACPSGRSCWWIMPPSSPECMA